MIGNWFMWFSEGALRFHTLLPQRLAPLPGSLTRSGALENGLPRSLGATP